MIGTQHRRLKFAPGNEQGLPILLESIGYNKRQEKIGRPEGYPHYHWLQTYSGAGEVQYADKTVTLPPGSGILLSPGVPHSYEASSDAWETLYLTFGGPVAGAVLESLGMSATAYYKWEPEAPLSGMVMELLDDWEREDDRFGFDGSAGVYRFLLILSKYGQLHHNSPISHNLARLQPLLHWMEERYGDPAIGLPDLAERLGMSGRQLNNLFVRTFGLSPYAYFLRLRIRKSKELLLGDRSAAVQSVAAKAGFRDVSHFVATFRRQTGVTPEQFRRLH